LPYDEIQKSSQGFFLRRNMSEKLEQLKERLGEVHALRRAASILEWDQQVNMPALGSEARGQQLATLGKIAQEKFISDEVGRLIEDLKTEFNGAGPESDEAALLRVAARDYEKARRVAPEFLQQQAIVASNAYSAWWKLGANPISRSSSLIWRESRS